MERRDEGRGAGKEMGYLMIEVGGRRKRTIWSRVALMQHWIIAFGEAEDDLSGFGGGVFHF